MSFEILEHTADVGLRARAHTLEDLFVQATHALLSITGGADEGTGEPVGVDVQAPDLGALLVDWLSEILYVQDARDSVVRDVAVDRVASDRAQGKLVIAPRGDRVLEGTAVKAITYHQLKVEQVEGEWVAEVYVDV